jgi:hypothetical protein
MATERICKYPGCIYYDKEATCCCCSACEVSYYSEKQLDSIITETRKEKNIMDKIKQEWSYKTSDGTLFSGKFAKRKAQAHQKKINFRESVKDLIPAAHEIFGIKKPNLHEDGETDEEIVVDRLNAEFGWEANTFEEALNYLVILYLEIPELSGFFQFLEGKLDEYK